MSYKDVKRELIVDNIVAFSKNNWAATCSKPDIKFGIYQLSKFHSSPGMVIKMEEMGTFDGDKLIATHKMEVIAEKRVQGKLLDPDSKLFIKFYSVPQHLYDHRLYNTPTYRHDIISDGEEIYFIGRETDMDIKYPYTMGSIMDIPKETKQDGLDVANAIMKYMIEKKLL
jgi:hypothetical protein